MSSVIWTTEDFIAGRCESYDVGELKPQPPAPPLAAPEAPEFVPVVEVMDPKESLTSRLERDAHAAYVELGGKEYLKGRPSLLDKVLAKAATLAPTPSRSPLTQQFPVLSWVTARRLMYKESVQIAQDILDKRIAPPESKPSSEPDK